MPTYPDTILVPSGRDCYGGQFSPSSAALQWVAPSPPSANVGSPSGAFVATLVNGSAAVVVTPQSDKAGTWAPTSRTLTPEAPSGSFNFTASEAGAHSVTLANDIGISSPGAIAFTAVGLTYLIALALADTATAGVAAPGTITNAGTGPVSWSFPAVAGATLSPTSGTLAAGATQDFTFTGAAGSYTVNVSAPGATITGNGQNIVVSAPSAGLTVGAQITSLAVKSVSGSGSRPYAATVLLRQGQVPSGSHITNSTGTEKAAIGATYPDGSAAWAVLPGAASADGTVAVHIATGTPPADLTAAAVAAAGVTSVAINFGGSYGAASITSFGSPERVWWATPTYICVRYRVAAPTPGSTALEAVIDVHAWAGRALVEVTVENSKLNSASPAAPAAASYTGATVSINGGTVATVNAAGAPETTHAAFRAWYASGWVGGDPGLRVTQAHADLQLHPLLFKCDQASSADLSTYASDSYSPWSTGRQRATNMGGTGDHPSIGPLPKWEAQALQTGDSRAWNATEVSALAVLGYNVNYRDTTTGLVPTITELAGKSQQSNWPVQSNVSDAMMWKDSHHPAAGLMAFIGRPSPVFIELAPKVAVWNATSSQYADGGPSYSTGVFGTAYQMRGWAWCLRSLTHATFLTPSALPWKAAGATSMAANFAWWDAYRTDSKAVLNCMWVNRVGQPLASSTPTPVNIKTWQYHYFIAEAHKAASSGLLSGADQTTADTLVDWICREPVRWINEQTNGSWRYMPENFVLADAASTPPTMVSLSTIDAQRANWMTDTGTVTSTTGTWLGAPTEGGRLYADYVADNNSGITYAAYMWPALCAAVDRGVTGAATAWNTVQASITNLSTWKAGFSTDPRYGSTPLNPPAPAGFATGGGTGTLVGAVWTPARAPDGRVYAESWAIVPTGTWIEAAGSRLDSLTSAITAPGWDASTLRWAFTLNAWNGFAIDTAGARVWLAAAGGHADSSNNGVYRFDCYKMAWAVERQPSDRTAWSSQYRNLTAPQSGTYTTCYESANATPQAGVGEYGMQAGVPQKYYFDQLYWDRRPTSRHVYAGAVYDSSRDEICIGARSVWRYSIADGDWTFSRRFPAVVDGAELNCTYDEVTDEFLFTGMGDGVNQHYAYDIGADTFSAFSPPWSGKGIADCRYGRIWTAFEPLLWDQSGHGYYYRYDLDSRAATASGQVQLSGVTQGEFRGVGSPGYDGGIGMAYVPGINKYLVVLNMASGVRWLQLDPTTSPWTLSPWSHGGTAPATYDKPGRKVVYMPGLNALIFCNKEDRGVFIYRF